MQVNFDVWHEDGLVFEEHPELFVLLDRTPIVWTVRGLRLFRPRFAACGVDIRGIRTPSQFEEALSRWLKIEYDLLASKIAASAAPAKAFPSLEALCLQAIVEGDIDRAEELISRLEAR